VLTRTVFVGRKGVIGGRRLRLSSLQDRTRSHPSIVWAKFKALVEAHSSPANDVDLDGGSDGLARRPTPQRDPNGVPFTCIAAGTGARKDRAVDEVGVGPSRLLSPIGSP